MVMVLLGYISLAFRKNSTTRVELHDSSVKKGITDKSFRFNAPRILILFLPVFALTLIVPFAPLSCHILAFTTLCWRWHGSKKRTILSSNPNNVFIFSINSFWTSTEGVLLETFLVFLKDKRSFFLKVFAHDSNGRLCYIYLRYIF